MPGRVSNFILDMVSSDPNITGRLNRFPKLNEFIDVYKRPNSFEYRGSPDFFVYTLLLEVLVPGLLAYDPI